MVRKQDIENALLIDMIINNSNGFVTGFYLSYVLKVIRHWSISQHGL